MNQNAGSGDGARGQYTRELDFKLVSDLEKMAGDLYVRIMARQRSFDIHQASEAAEHCFRQAEVFIHYLAEQRKRNNVSETSN